MRLWNEIKKRMLSKPKQYVDDGHKKMTYGEIIRNVESIVPIIRQKKCCGILCKSELNTTIALLGCFAAGVTAVPLSFRYGKTLNERILQKIKPDVVVRDEEGHVGVEIQSVDCCWSNGSHPLLIMSTSGTTGEPKCIMLSEQNIITNVNDILKYFEVLPTDKILITRPLFHCAALTGELLVGLYSGANIHFFTEEFNPLKVKNVIKDNHITVICGTPTLIQMLARAKCGDKINLRVIGISGECMTRQAGNYISEAFYNTKIYHYYGLTEASPRVCYLPADLFKTHCEYVGLPLSSVETKILDADGSETAVGDEGILWVKGNNIMMGYYGDDYLTKQVLKDGWLCTFDIAVMDHTGLLKIVGRKDDMIIKGGMNIYPMEIENCLKDDKRVNEVVAYGFVDADGLTKIGIRVSGHFRSEKEVSGICRELLPTYSWPSEIVLLDKLPKNENGKVIRGRMINE